MAAEVEVKILGEREFVWKIKEYTLNKPGSRKIDNTVSFDPWMGYVIITNKRTIKFLVESTQSCCEEVGYACDVLAGSVPIQKVLAKGMEILDVGWGHKPICASRKENKGVDADIEYTDKGYHYACVNIKTPVEIVQLVAFNYSNGCYPRMILFSNGTKDDIQDV